MCEKGKCTTCRNYKQDADGCYCAVWVADKGRGNKEPCGWWESKRKRKSKPRGDAE